MVTNHQEGMYVLTCQGCGAFWHSLYPACLCSCGRAVYEGTKRHRHRAVRVLNRRLARVGLDIVEPTPLRRIHCSVCGDLFTPADRRYQLCSDACRAERERLRIAERNA